MFTIYIHVLEVLAMHSDGADMCKIGNMGSCFSMVQIQKAVRELEKDGFITRHRTAGGRVYKITDKAIEYCENVTRAYTRVHDVNIVDKSVFDAEMVAQDAQEPMFTERVTTHENMASIATTEGFLDVSETYLDLNSPDNTEENYNECMTCHRMFIPRISSDEFQCNSCYEHEPWTEQAYLVQNDPSEKRPWSPEWGCQKCGDKPLVGDSGLCETCLWE